MPSTSASTGSKSFKLTKDAAMESPPKKKRKQDKSLFTAKKEADMDFGKPILSQPDEPLQLMSQEKETKAVPNLFQTKPKPKAKSSKDSSSGKKKPVLSFAMQLVKERNQKVKDKYVERITKIYKKHKPDKVAGVQKMVDKYGADQAHTLYGKICTKYGEKALEEFTGETPDVIEEEAETTKDAPSTKLKFDFGANKGKKADPGPGFKFDLSSGGDSKGGMLGAGLNMKSASKEPLSFFDRRCKKEEKTEAKKDSGGFDFKFTPKGPLGEGLSKSSDKKSSSGLFADLNPPSVTKISQKVDFSKIKSIQPLQTNKAPPTLNVPAAYPNNPFSTYSGGSTPSLKISLGNNNGSSNSLFNSNRMST